MKTIEGKLHEKYMTSVRQKKIDIPLNEPKLRVVCILNTCPLDIFTWVTSVTSVLICVPEHDLFVFASASHVTYALTRVPAFVSTFHTALRTVPLLLMGGDGVTVYSCMPKRLGYVI